MVNGSAATMWEARFSVHDLPFTIYHLPFTLL